MTKAFLIDALERVGSSFVEAIIAAILAGAVASGVNASTVHVLLIAGLTAAVTTGKTLLASKLPTRGASLVPNSPKAKTAKKA